MRGNNKEKVVITGKGNDFVMKKTINDNVVESNLTSKKLSSELKAKEFAFAKKYVKNIK
jgi:hypothetical protein